MPRNVRNFWLEGSIDGRASGFSGGPQARDGGFSLTIKQRDNGSVTTAAEIWGHVNADGSIRLEIRAAGETLEVRTTR